MKKYKCIHTWTETGSEDTPLLFEDLNNNECGDTPGRIVSYVLQGEAIPRIDLTCEDFLEYHKQSKNHRGIELLYLAPKEVRSYTDALKFLRDKEEEILKGTYERANHEIFRSSFRIGHIIDEGIKRAYNSLENILKARIEE